MAFDITTARPVENTPQIKKGFDISTARPMQPATVPTPEKKDLIYSMAGITPDELAAQGHPVAAAFQKAGHDMVTVPAHFFNQLLLNAPRSIANTAGFQYPEESGNKIIDNTAKVAGVVGALKTGSKILAPKSLAGKMAVAGAEGMAYSPNDNFLDMKQRAVQGGIASALPVAGVGVSKIAKGTTNLIKTGIDAVKKSAPDYITSKVAPAAYETYQKAVNQFTPRIQNFARKTLGLSENAIQSIKKRGTGTVQKIRQTYNDSTDEIYQNIKNGIEKYKQTADLAYKNAVKSHKGTAIESGGFYRAVQSGLRKKGWIDLTGNPTNRYKTGLDPVIDRMTDLYLSMRPTATSKGKNIAGKVISKEDFFTYRDALGAMLKDKPSDSFVMQARNALYTSAEDAGMQGLKNARNLENKYFTIRKRYLNSSGDIKALGQEKSLDRFQKMTQEQRRQLRELENVTNIKFVDDLDAITAAREIDKLTSYNMNKFTEDFNKAVDPKWTKYIKAQYMDLLGEQETNKIFNNIVQHRRGVNIKKGALQAGGVIAGGAGAYQVGRKIFGQ